MIFYRKIMSKYKDNQLSFFDSSRPPNKYS